MQPGYVHAAEKLEQIPDAQNFQSSMFCCGLGLFCRPWKRMDEDYSHNEAFYILRNAEKIPIHLFLKCQNVLQLLLNFTKESLIIHFSFIGGWKKNVSFIV